MAHQKGTDKLVHAASRSPSEMLSTARLHNSKTQMRTAWTDLLSVEDAAEAVAAITDATQLELQSCITDIYLMGIEDGRVLEREVY